MSATISPADLQFVEDCDGHGQQQFTKQTDFVVKESKLVILPRASCFKLLYKVLLAVKSK
jgi:hypothetical protein